MQPLPQMSEVGRVDDEQACLEEFWLRIEAGQLELQSCAQCGRFRWPASPLCPACDSWQSQWEPVVARGKVWSLTTYRHAFDKRFAADLPYTVVLMELPVGIRIVGRAVGDAGIGDELELVFPVDTERRRLYWRKG